MAANRTPSVDSGGSLTGVQLALFGIVIALCLGGAVVWLIFSMAPDQTPEDTAQPGSQGSAGLGFRVPGDMGWFPTG